MLRRIHASGLLVVHPDFPWSGAVVENSTIETICLPALRRIVATAHRRKTAGRPIIVMPFHRPAKCPGEPGRLVRELVALASLVAPPRLNAIAARKWLSSHAPAETFETAGFWTDRCVAVISRDVNARVNLRLGASSREILTASEGTQQHG